MTLGIDQDLMNGLYGREIQTFTTEEKDVYDRGEALFLLTMAYKSPEIMELLRRVAASEGDTQQQKLNNVVTLH